MSALALHNQIEKYNVLHKPTAQIKEYFKQHPHLHKVALLANHIFRALSMTALSFFLPSSLHLVVGFYASLFYRLTVETNCAYKFALPAFAGSIAFPLAFTALNQLVSGVALATFPAFLGSMASLLPLAGYLTYIVLTVSYDVDSRR